MTATQDAPAREGPLLSIIVPLHNEVANVGPCCEEIRQVMAGAGLDYELILVDDGSTDGTLAAATAAIEGDERAQLIELRRNFGQASALEAGFDRARGTVVVPMDGDLQNDPRDIPALVRRLDEAPGWDVVSGWRKDRQDSLARRLSSRIANLVISSTTGVKLHDYGCTLKAYRREVLADVRLYGEMHRFILALATWVGGRVTEMPVNYRPRRAGESKYGFGRVFRVLCDLMTVKFLLAYATKPLYFFGKVGLYCMFLAFFTLCVVLVQKLGYATDMTGNPLLYLSAAFLIISVQVVLMGLMMEMITRTYHESQGRRTYGIRAVHCGGRKEKRL